MTGNLSANEFDDKARTWDNNPGRVDRANAIAAAIEQEIPADRSFTALEYGCGTGLLSFPLRDRFSHITLIDSSQGMLDVIREKIGRNNVQNMDVVNIDLLQQPVHSISKLFSVIYNLLVLHHIKDVGIMLRIWHSLLAVPGYLCVADLDSDNGLFHGPEFDGHNGFDREALGKLAMDAGFSKVRFKTAYTLRKIARDGVERTFPLFLMIAEKSAP